MATTIKRLMYEHLETIPQEREGDRHELVDGELVVTPSPRPTHQMISVNIEFALVRHVREHDLGMVLDAPIDVRLTPDNVLVPDLVFIARDRLHIIGPKAIDAAPDLIVEILSPGTKQRDLSMKRALYARFGVQEYWVVEPEARSVTTLMLVGDMYEKISSSQADTVPSRVLPRLALNLNEVFKGL
jgi:Uma2 family endonuclease